MTRSITTFRTASAKMAWAVHSRRGPKDRVYSTPHHADELCHQCINKIWEPPAVLLWAWNRAESRACSRCGCKIEPCASAKNLLRARKTHGPRSRAEAAKLARRMTMDENRRTRDLQRRGKIRVEHEILKSDRSSD